MRGKLHTAVVASATVLGALAAAPAGVAESGRLSDLSLQLTSRTPGTPTGIVSHVAYHAAGDPGAKPPPVTLVDIGLPAGIGLDNGAVPRCQATDGDIQAQGPNACPADTRVGRGEFEGITGFGPPVDPFVGDTQVFNGSGQLIEVVTVKGTDQSVGSDRLTISGTHLVAHPPATPGGPPDGRTTVRRVDFTLPVRGAGTRPYVLTPPECPPSGVWVTRGRFAFADGSSDAVNATSPCERGSSRGGARLRLSVRPRTAVAGRRTRFRLRAGGARACSAGAAVSLAGRRARTDARGRATIVATLAGSGRRAARVAKPGCSGALTWVRVRRP